MSSKTIAKDEQKQLVMRFRKLYYYHKKTEHLEALCFLLVTIFY